jgi:hypothetical protein
MGVPRRVLRSGRFLSGGRSAWPVRGMDAGLSQPGQRPWCRPPPHFGRSCRCPAGPLAGIVPGGTPGARVSAGPAGSCESLACCRRWSEFAFADLCCEEGEGFADAFQLVLDLLEQPGGEAHPGPGSDGHDQRQNNGAEAVCRGQGGGVVHANKLVRVAPTGQGKNRMFR